MPSGATRPFAGLRLCATVHGWKARTSGRWQHYVLQSLPMPWKKSKYLKTKNHLKKEGTLKQMKTPQKPDKKSSKPLNLQPIPQLLLLLLSRLLLLLLWLCCRLHLRASASFTTTAPSSSPQNCTLATASISATSLTPAHLCWQHTISTWPPPLDVRPSQPRCAHKGLKLWQSYCKINHYHQDCPVEYIIWNSASA